MNKLIEAEHFNTLIKEINKGIIDGHIDKMIVKLNDALNFYEDNQLNIEILNVFEFASNVIQAVSKRAFFLEVINRVINIAKQNKLEKTVGIYCRYLALAQAFYGSPDRGFEIIKDAEAHIDMDSGLMIELRNAMGLIYSEISDYEKSLETFEFNYSETLRIDYQPGRRFLHNIGSAYLKLEKYDQAIEYIKKGIEYDFEAGYEVNGIYAMIELAEVFYQLEDYDSCMKTLRQVNQYDVSTTNRNIHKSFCDLMYRLMKKLNRFEEALRYHETLNGLELQLNMDKYTGMIAELNMKYDLVEKEAENTVIKSKNYDLEIMSEKLNNMNKFLKTTLKKSNDMQEELMAKNQELEATMESLHDTQEQLLLAEKRSVLDGVFINIAQHMSTPLGVMNTSTSHLIASTRKLRKKFDNNKMGKQDLLHYFEDNMHIGRLYNDSMNKLIGFVDTLKLYKKSEDEELTEINLLDYLNSMKLKYSRFKGIDDIKVNCDNGILFVVNINLLEKCLDLITNKLVVDSNRNGFDIDVSKEGKVLTIGIGDLSTQSDVTGNNKETSIVDTYDFYIIQTIVENLLKGRFIKFDYKGRNYFQFIFQLEG